MSNMGSISVFLRQALAERMCELVVLAVEELGVSSPWYPVTSRTLVALGVTVEVTIDESQVKLTWQPQECTVPAVMKADRKGITLFVTTKTQRCYEVRLGKSGRLRVWRSDLEEGYAEVESDLEIDEIFLCFPAVLAAV